jgi:hypothetical protein
MGFEIAGNSEGIQLCYLVHGVDIELLKTAYMSQYFECMLTSIDQDEIIDLNKYDWAKAAIADFYPTPPYSHLFTQPSELRLSPLETAITAIKELPPETCGIIQFLFKPVGRDHNWHKNINILLDLEYSMKLLSGFSVSQQMQTQQPSGEIHGMAKDVRVKAHNDKPIFAGALRIAVLGPQDGNSDLIQKIMVFNHLFQHGGRPLQTITESDYLRLLKPDHLREMFALGISYRHGFILNSNELAGMIHILPSNEIEQREFPLDVLNKLPLKNKRLLEGTPIGICSNAGNPKFVCIPELTRSRSCHLIARHGMGKSTAMEHMILDDIGNGAGVAVLDPHGDLVNRLTKMIPREFIERTIYFQPGDTRWIPLWNPIRPLPGQDLARITDDLVAAIKSIVHGWGDRLENLLRQAIFALLHLPNMTLLDVYNLLRKESKESKILIHKILDVVENETSKLFWQHDFNKYSNADLTPPKHKLSKLLLSGSISLMLSQPENRIVFREIMDTGKILLLDLSGVGTEARDLLGSFVLSLFHIATLSRSKESSSERRKPFHIYCDEAH